MKTLSKNLFAIILTAISVVACGAAGKVSNQSTEDSENAKLIGQVLDSRSYKIDVSWVSPLRGPGNALTGSYSVTVDGETLDSYLPYIGDASYIPYGGGKGLIFKEDIDKYEDAGWEKESRTITISISNEEDSYVYKLTVFDNGRADISVNCRNRDSISFSGQMVIEPLATP